MRILKQSTSVDVPIGPFLDSTDGVTAETALTITQPDIRLKKNGAAWAQKNAAQTLSHEENGNYEVTLDATDTNTLGLLRLHVAESGALPVWEDFMVVPANVWDSWFGSDLQQVDVTHWLNSAAAALTGDPYAAAVATTAALAAFPLKRNTGSQHVPFYMRDSTDPTIGKTGVPTITKSIDGAAAWSSTTGTVTEIGLGGVDFSPSAADCNGTLVRFKATLTGAVPQIVDVYTHV
jgi:hypothetical protein